MTFVSVLLTGTWYGLGMWEAQGGGVPTPGLRVVWHQWEGEGEESELRDHWGVIGQVQ